MISLIVPVYNAEKYLDACVRSILAQDEADWELLLVDDASADTSLSICERYAAEDERIHVIRASHGGAAAARNRGIEAAKGAWITFVDSDDTVEPYYLSYLLGLTEGGADIAACAHDKPREGEAAVALPGSAGATFYEGDDVLKTLLYQRGLMSVPWGYLSRRSLWEHVRFPEGTEAEDMGTIYRLFMEAGSLMVGRRVCYHYIQRKGNTIYSTAESRRKAYWRHSREMLKQVRIHRPACLAAARGRHFSACAQNLSETPLLEKGSFRKTLYRELRLLAPSVMKDGEGRIQNRVAAAISRVSVAMLHILLRAAYRIRLNSL